MHLLPGSSLDCAVRLLALRIDYAYTATCAANILRSRLLGCYAPELSSLCQSWREWNLGRKPARDYIVLDKRLAIVLDQRFRSVQCATAAQFRLSVKKGFLLLNSYAKRFTQASSLSVACRTSLANAPQLTLIVPPAQKLFARDNN